MKKDTKTTAKEVAAKTETAVKATVAKAETAVKATAAKAETAAKKAAVKKPAAKKAAVKKPAAKKPAARKTAPKEPVVNAVLQFAGKETTVAELVAQAKAAWTGDAIKEVNLYIKPEDSRVYVVINGEVAESIEL